MTGTLQIADLEKMAPSIFAKHGAPNVSPNYKFIPTIDTVEAMMSAGFYPVSAQETRSRKAEKQGHTKHLLRFRKEGLVEVGGLIPEIVLLNSHDGSTSYQLRGGVYRMVCSNGLIVGDDIFLKKVRHQGDINNNILLACNEILEAFPSTLETAQRWSSIEVSLGIQLQFAEKASKMKWQDQIKIRSDDLLRARRQADMQDNLWTLLNRVQENIIRGGISYIAHDEQGNPYRQRTRRINSVQENVRVNTQLWNLTKELEEVLV